MCSSEINPSIKRNQSTTIYMLKMVYEKSDGTDFFFFLSRKFTYYIFIRSERLEARPDLFHVLSKNKIIIFKPSILDFRGYHNYRVGRN